MGREVQTFGHVDAAGRLLITARPAFESALHALAGREITLTVKVRGRQRSNPQLRYYRGLVVPLITAAINEAWGEQLDDDEVHELLKRKFNSRKVETENGYVCIAASTTRLDTAEFAAYVETIRAWAADFFGLDIPDPVSITANAKPLRG